MLRSLALLAGLVGVAAGVVWAAERGETPPHLRGADPTSETAPHVVEESLGPGLHLAGSGSSLQVTRALAAAFRVAHPGARVVVHDSIGSTGGVRAAAEGAVAIGLVARALRPSERDLGLTVIDFARLPVTLLAHPDVRDLDITSEEILRSLRGESTSWRDGTPRVWLLRERGDAGTAVLGQHIEGFDEATEDAIATARFRVVYHDDELLRSLLGLRGGVGIADLPQARTTTARVLSIDGRVPTVAGVVDGSYPLFKDLSFVVRDLEDREVARFLDFAASAEGRAVIAGCGAAPLPLEAAP